ncbi:MAG TPA: AAA family ATPase [Myxococcota bacterium]|nr:AAA family ATPase [Myxococcota bacterium]
MIEFASFRLDGPGERLWRGKNPVALRAKTWQVLRYLAENPGRVVTTEELLNAVWRDAHVTPGTLGHSISELRRALNDDTHEPRIIATVHGRGFRFIAKTRRLIRPNDASPLSFSFLDPHKEGETRVLHGRERELERLGAIFRKAQAGRRQIAFVTGEAGIGKTSVVKTFLEGLADAEEPVWVAWGQCVEHHGEREAYLPIFEALDRLARGAGADPVRRALHRFAPTWLHQMPGLLQPEEGNTAPATPPRIMPTRMLREFYLAAEALAAERTLVLCLEDLHWSDPSTVDLLSALMKRPDATRLLVLATYRPVEAAMGAHPIAALRRSLLLENACENLALELLDEAAVQSYLGSRFATDLDPALTTLICRITDGNPLFIVTLVSHFISQGWLKQTDTRWKLLAAPDWLRETAPESLKAVLEARLAQCSAEEVEVLEAASVAGETPSAQTIAAALGVEVSTVEKACGRLAGWGWFLEGAGPALWPDGSVGERYGFLHAAFRRILYDRVASGRRQQLHLSIARRLEVGYGNELGALAAEMALHCERGGDPKGAIEHLRRAAAGVQRRFARREAVNYLTHALDILRALPHSDALSRYELELRLELARSVLVAVGYAAVEREANLARALALATELSDYPSQSLVLGWLTRSQNAGCSLYTARILAEQNATLVSRVDDPALLAQIHTGLGTNALLRGELKMAEREHALVPSLLGGLDPRGPTNLLGHDPAVMALAFSAWTAWLRGHPDEASRRAHAARSRAEAVGDAFAAVTALVLSESVEQFRRVPESVDSLERLAARHLDEHGFGFTYAWPYAAEGWLWVQRGEVEAGIDRLQQGVSAVKSAGALLGLSLLLATLAEAELVREAPRAGMVAIDEAMSFIGKSGERFWEVEIHRLRGELLRLDPRLGSAESSFQKALEVARDQGARSLELRAAMSLARLWRDLGQSDAAHSLVSDVYGGFTEGLDTPDLREASALMDSV